MEEKEVTVKKEHEHIIFFPNNYAISFKEGFILIADKENVVAEIDIKNGFDKNTRNKIAEELFIHQVYTTKDEAKQQVQQVMKEIIKKYRAKMGWDIHKQTANIRETKFGSFEQGTKKPDLYGLRVDNFQYNVEMHHTQNPFFYDKQNIFWKWNNDENKYQIVDDVDMMIDIEKFLQFNGQTVNSHIRNSYIEAFKRIGRQNIPLPAQKKWIQFKDKAFSLKSGEVYDVTPKYFFTNPIPWEMGESSDTPIMDKLFMEWVGEKYVSTLYEIIAYCCYSDYPIHLIFCFVGCGRNGKSQFQGLIHKFIGLGNICSTELDTLIDSRFESFKLYKKLVCSMGETNFGVLNKTSLLKRLSSGKDLIGFEYKNKMPFDEYNYAKIIISSNSLPTSEDTSEGFYRRWCIIDFPNQFDEGADILETIPLDEYNALAKKITEILPELLKKGSFINQGSIEERKERYINASNPLSVFIKAYCTQDNGVFITYSELYSAYSRYLLKIKKRVIGRKEFSNFLSLEGLEFYKTSKYVNGDTIKATFVFGITLNEIFKNEFDGLKGRTPHTPDTPQSFISSLYRERVGTSGVSGVLGVNIQEEYIDIEKVVDLESDKKSDIEHLKLYIETYPKDNAVKIEQFFGDNLVTKWKQEGIILESPTGTYRLIR